MGQPFELIADNALEKLGEHYNECHICEKSDCDLYQYQGQWQKESGEIDDDIYAICSNCILTKNLAHICDFEYIEIIEEYLAKTNLTAEERELRKKSLTSKYQKTPNIPTFMQYEDRPLCCNDITEFIGHPTNKEELYRMTENVLYWEKQIKEKSEFYDFRKYGNPESYSDVASFKCKHCENKYFTFQFT